jgi:hypothetical protein
VHTRQPEAHLDPPPFEQVDDQARAGWHGAHPVRG